MAFLAPLLPAVLGSATTAGISALTRGQQSSPGMGPQTQATPTGNYNGPSAELQAQRKEHLEGLQRQANDAASRHDINMLASLTQDANNFQKQNQTEDANAAKQAQQDVVNQGYNQSQGAISQQQGLADALRGGVQKQSQVYDQLQQQLASQQGLGQQLGEMAQGKGPNPALAQLAQTTGQNVSNQAALMAGQRGAGANTGLLARQAGQQGGAIQQQATGQAATLRAQQQLAAINGLQQQQAMQGQTLGQLGALSGSQVGQQQNSLQSLFGMSNGEQQTLQNGILEQNKINAGQAESQNKIQGDQGMQQAKFLNDSATGLASGVGAGLATLVTPKKFQGFADGGMIQAIGKENYKGRSKTGQLLAHGGKAKSVDALVSPGEIYISPKEAKAVKKGDKAPMRAGHRIPGTPAVPGDVNSYANDTVHKKLQAGGIIIPRSVTMSANPDAKAKQFIEALKAKRK